MGCTCLRGIPITSYNRSEHTAACATPRKGGAGRVAELSHGSEDREDKKEKKSLKYISLRQNVHRARFFGDLVADLDVKGSHRRYDTERADPRRRPSRARRGHASAKNPRRKAVRGGRDPQTKE